MDRLNGAFVALLLITMLLFLLVAFENRAYADEQPILASIVEQINDKMQELTEEPEAIISKPLPAYEHTDADLQYPSYPTGCEGVSASVMLRMNGIQVTNDQFMEALPKGGAEDFVHAFWGEPSSHAGFACMPPAIVDTSKQFLPNDKTVLDLTGTDLVDLPTPASVWTTMYFCEPMPTEYEQEGYHLFYNTHCVVLLSCSEGQVHLWDPLQGYVDVSFETFDHIYNTMGKLAVYVAPRGYGNE